MLSANRESFANNGRYEKTSVIREFSNNGCSRITDFYWTKLDPLFANFTVLYFHSFFVEIFYDNHDNMSVAPWLICATELCGRPMKQYKLIKLYGPPTSAQTKPCHHRCAELDTFSPQRNRSFYSWSADKTVVCPRGFVLELLSGSPCGSSYLFYSTAI